MATRSTPPKNKLSNWARLGLFWAIIAFAVLIMFAVVAPTEQLKEVPISTVIEKANSGKITKIEGSGNDIKVTEKGQNKPTERSYIQGGVSTLLREDLLNKDAKKLVSDAPPSQTGEMLWNLFIFTIPIIIIIGFFMFMMRQAQGQNNQALGFGKSKSSAVRFR